MTDVAYNVEIGNRRRTICTCICDCGNTISTVADRLSGGHKTSCGCDTTERRVSSLRKDLTGQRFGRLVVAKMLWGRPTRCECICDCGNVTTVINTGLTSGKTQSCGCYHRQRTAEANAVDFTDVVSDSGIKFIRRKEQNTHGVWLWECECPFCHSRFTAIPAKVMEGNVISCGCARSSYGEEVIKQSLDSFGVHYLRQYRFADCKDRYTLPFDFAILNDYNEVIHLIEFDGKQHFEPIAFFGGEDAYNVRKSHDKQKELYAQHSNIPLTRIPYSMSAENIISTIKNIMNP